MNSAPAGFQPAYVVGEDTFAIVNLPGVYIFPEMKFKNKKEQDNYYKLIRDVKRTLPYAKMVY